MDPRPLNAMTIQLPPLSNMTDGLLQDLAGAFILALFDMLTKYLQMRLKPEMREWFAFATPGDYF